MTLSEFVLNAHLLATGRRTPPGVDTPEYKKYVDLANFYIDEWQNDSGIDWASLYDPDFSIGTVTATDTFELDLAIRKISNREGDAVRIEWDDGVGTSDYLIVSHDKLKDFYAGQSKASPSGFYCAKMGNQLVFNKTFASTDDEFGGDIQVPVYLYADTLVDKDDEIPVDDPRWLVYTVVVDLIADDPKKQNKYRRMLKSAQESMQRMRDANQGQSDVIDTPWTAPGGIGIDSVWG